MFWIAFPWAFYCEIFVVGSVTDSDTAANEVAENVVVMTPVGINKLATVENPADNFTYRFGVTGSIFAIDSTSDVIEVATVQSASHNFNFVSNPGGASTCNSRFTITALDVSQSA